MKNVLAIILGGGRGGRLFPLTKYRSKPAVPIAGKYRLIDIPISNCLNSAFNKIYVLTQFNSESLNKHISRAYKLDSFSHGFVEIIAAEQHMENTHWFQGTADAVRQSLRHFTDPRFEYFLVLSGDHLYAMDLREVMKTHLRKKAEVTVCCKPVLIEEAEGLGVMKTNAAGRIVRFMEKPPPRKLREMSFGKRGKRYTLASMGIYVFGKEVLKELLTKSKKSDFGRGIIPDAIGKRKVFAHLFHGYWMDIGTVKAYYDASISLASRTPPINFYDETWPFFTRSRYLPVSRLDGSQTEDALIADGTLMENVSVRRSIIGLRSIIQSGTEIDASIIMGNDYFEEESAKRKSRRLGIPDIGIGKNCVIQRAIIDKNARIGDDVRIINRRHRAKFEGKNYMIVDGITVVEKNAVIPSGTVL